VRSPHFHQTAFKIELCKKGFQPSEARLRILTRPILDLSSNWGIVKSFEEYSMSESCPDLSPAILKATQGFVALANNPMNTDAVFDLADGLRHTDLYPQFITYAHQQPDMARLLQERYFGETPDLDALLTLSPDSLGYRYATEMKAQGLAVDFYRALVIEDDYSYLAMRMRQTHDIWHILTGFGTDLAGELGLQAFTLAQTRSPLAIALLSSVMMFALKSELPLSPLVGSIHQGWQIGEHALPFLAQKWEEGWEIPVTVWREKLRVIPMGKGEPG
jgi:ubiquinone biosynthesis protein Coq4